MKSSYSALFASAILLVLGSIPLFGQTTYSGNGSTGFGGPLGNSTLTVSDNPTTGTITFSLAATATINNVAFYFSTGSGGVSDTSSITDTGDPGRRSISGQGTSAGHTVATFANGFSAKYAVAIDNNGNANLFQIVPGQSYLSYVAGANDTQVSGANGAVTYGFSLTESQLGITAGSSFSFVATLSNAQDGTNASQVYRSNETIGASNVDNNLMGNLGNTGNLIYSGFDTYATSVPEPATWLGAALCVALLGKALVSRRRSVVATV